MSETNMLEPETITIRPDDPATLAHAFERVLAHIDALHMDIGLLSVAIGVLVNAGDAGHLATPNAARELLNGVIELYGGKAPLSAVQLRAALDAPIGSPPPNGGRRLRIVQGEKKAA